MGSAKFGRLRILFAGLGSIGQRHLRNVKRLLGDGVEILAWRVRRLGQVLTDDMTVAQGLDLEERYGIRVFSTLESALAEKPTVVFVTNPTDMHFDTAVAAAEAGCHLFIEKPLAHTLDGIERLFEAVKRNNLVATVGYQMRHHPVMKCYKSLVQGGTVGPLLAVRHEQGENIADWHQWEDYRRLFGARKDQAGGVLLSQIHEIDAVYWLFDMPRSVYALGGHWTSLEVDVEDVVSIMFQCEHRGRPLPVHLQQNYVQRPPTRVYQALGDSGLITADLMNNRVSVTFHDRSEGAVFAFENFQRNEMYLAELENFLQAVNGGSKVNVSLEEALDGLRIVVAAHKSMEKGELVVP